MTGRAARRRVVLAVVVVVAVTITSASSVGAEWPLACPYLNDIVERHLGNVGNVGIYERQFGAQAEEACRREHLEDVRTTFEWVFTPSRASESPETHIPPESSGWPTTCVELNDMIERQLGNYRNVGLYQQAFGKQAEAQCRSEHRDDVLSVFAWAHPCKSVSGPDPSRPALTSPNEQRARTVAELSFTEPTIDSYLSSLPWLSCHVFDWLNDGVSEYDASALQLLWYLGNYDPEDALARRVASFPWFVDGVLDTHMADGERSVLVLLRELHWNQSELVDVVLDFDWIADDITDSEARALGRLKQLADIDLAFALRTAQSPWMQDRIASHEPSAIYHLMELFKQDHELAIQMLEYTLEPNVKASDVLAIEPLQRLRRSNPERFHRLVHQPWYMDGLNAEERAFISLFGNRSDPLFSQLLENRYSQSMTITLPLTGEVTLWAFDSQPFPPGERVLEMAAEAAEELERFMGLRFPIDSILIGFLRYEDPYVGFGAWLSNTSTRMMIVRNVYPRLDRQTRNQRGVVYHEMSHYYFNDIDSYFPPSLASPSWLTEGGASAAEALIDDRLGLSSWRDRLREVQGLAHQECEKHGLDNILKLTVPNHPDSERWQRCVYILGQYLVLSLFDAVGERALALALSELYWTANYVPPTLGRTLHYPSDLEIFQTFLRHAPPGQADAVRDLYSRIHGGPYVGQGS